MRRLIILASLAAATGAVANVISDVVCDGCGVTRIVFRYAGFHLANKVRADISGLGKYAAANAHKKSGQ